MTTLLFNPKDVNGLQLGDEVRAASSLSSRADVGYVAGKLAVSHPGLASTDQVAVQAVVTAHVPNPDYGISSEQIALRAYATLKQWSVDAQAAYDAWPTQSNAQKDATEREVIRRLGVFFSRFADLLRYQGIN